MRARLLSRQSRCCSIRSQRIVQIGAPALTRVTQQVTDHAPLQLDEWDDILKEDEDQAREDFQRGVLQTGPMQLDLD